MGYIADATVEAEASRVARIKKNISQKNSSLRIHQKSPAPFGRMRGQLPPRYRKIREKLSFGLEICVRTKASSRNPCTCRRP